MPEDRGAATALEPRFYPNLIGRLYLISLEDVMGRNGVNALLNLAGARHLVNTYPPSNLKREFPFSDLTTISKSTETMYGPRGARGMELRAGRYAFNLGLKEFGPLLGADERQAVLPPGAGNSGRGVDLGDWWAFVPHGRNRVSWRRQRDLHLRHRQGCDRLADCLSSVSLFSIVRSA